MFADIFSSVDHGTTYFWILPLMALALPGSPISLPLTKKVNRMMSSTTINEASGWFKSVFITLVMLNLLGMAPFVFPTTSTIWLAAVVALIFWATILVTQSKIVPVVVASHLAPSGAPFLLSPLLVLIETVSILIRPLTLTVRLVANMTVGHVVCALLSVKLSTLSGTWPLATLMTFYVLFEFGVSVVQAYIFSLLLTLYSELLPASMNLMPLSVEKVMYKVCGLIPQTSPFLVLLIFTVILIGLLFTPFNSKLLLDGSTNAKVLSTFNVPWTLVFPTGFGPLSFGGSSEICFLGKPAILLPMNEPLKAI